MSNAYFRSLGLYLFLPPGPLPAPKVKQLLVLLVESYRWLKPTSYEVRGQRARTIAPGQPFIDDVIDTYCSTDDFWINGRTKNEGMTILLSPTYDGYLSCWWPSDKLVRGAQATETFVRQVVELMRLLDSPLAHAALWADAQPKTRWSDRGPYDSLVIFLNDYSQGLPGLFWRTFLGRPFVRLFGDRLASLPPDTARDLGGDIWLVQPYPTPADALTGGGKARERAIIEHLGKDCFFDHELELKPTRKPDLPPLDTKTLKREWKRRGLERTYGKGSPEVESSMKFDEFRVWGEEQRHKETPWFIAEVEQWARERLEDPILLQSTPEQVAEMLRARSKEPGPPPPTATLGEVAARLEGQLGNETVQTLLELGRIAHDVEKHAGHLVDPELMTKVRAVKGLAELATPPGPRRPPKKNTRRRK